jgi:ribosomal protein S18 acetylase RimI-like enzyme
MSQEGSLLVREMQPGDTTELQFVYLETRREKFNWLDCEEVSAGDFERDTEGEKVWVAEKEGRVVGFVAVWEPDHFIHHLFILPSFAGQRIGSELLATCLGVIGRPAQLKCLSANVEALSFYRAKGWRTIEMGESSDGEYHLMQLNAGR